MMKKRASARRSLDEKELDTVAGGFEVSELPDPQKKGPKGPKFI